MVNKNRHGNGISLLYAEDEPETRELVVRALARKYPEMRLITAANGAEGVDLYRTDQPDVVLTDINMPVMDGVRMAEAIKELNPEAVIVAVTAFSDTPYLLKAIEVGIGHYVLKPVDYAKLFKVVDKCMAQVALQRKVREQHGHIRKLSLAVEENPCGIVITDAEGFIEYVNPKFSEITGYSAAEAIGRTPRILKSDATPRETYEQLWSDITAGREWRGEFVNRKKNGDIYWEASSISPIVDDSGRITHFVAIKEDITPRKEANERIEILYTDLAARAYELELANMELEAFNRTVSHDLRAPLTSISGFCQVLLDLCEDISDECRGYIRQIYSSSKQMNELIDTLLDFSRLSRQELQREPVDLGLLAHGTAQRLSMTAPERRAEFRIMDDITVEGDMTLLQAVMDNLLGNAWKYSARRDLTVIEFGMTECEGMPVYFVRDNGAGFDMAQASRLFTPFERLHERGEFEGTGIGLATVQRIIQRHGGKVWAEGEPDRGATFYFTMGEQQGRLP
jgi:PAS domain S-box-containing protein